MKKDLKEKIERCQKEYEKGFIHGLESEIIQRDEWTAEKIREAKQNLIEEIDKVYKKEKGIHNWLDLREKLLKRSKNK